MAPSVAFLVALVLLLPAVASYTSLLGFCLRLLAFLLACLAASLGMAYLAELRGAKRRVIAKVPPFTFATPAAWASAKVKHQWSTKTATHEPLHIGMSTELTQATNELFQLIMSTFVGKWFDEITGPSASQAFPDAVERLVRHSLTRVIHRAERVDWAAFIVKKVVPRLTMHLSQFHHAESRMRGSDKVGEGDEMELLLANLFAGTDVRLHPAVDVASYSTRASEEAHLRSLVDSLLPELFPASECDSKAVRLVAREIVACTIALPLIEKLSDPDFWNRLIEEKAGAAVREQKMVKELRDALEAAPPNRSRSRRGKHSSGPAISAKSGSGEFDTFLRSVGRCATVGEARRLRSDLDINIRRTQLALSSAGRATKSDDKRRLAELTVYLERLFLARTKLNQRLQELGDTVAPATQHVASAGATVSLFDILQQPETLSLFMEYVDRRQRLPLLQFYLTIEGMRAPLEVEDFGSIVKPHIDASLLKEDARTLWTNYFANGSLQFSKPCDTSLLQRAAESAEPLPAMEVADVKGSIVALQLHALKEMDEHLYADFQESDLFLKAAASTRTTSSARHVRPRMPPRSTSEPEPASARANNPAAVPGKIRQISTTTSQPRLLPAFQASPIASTKGPTSETSVSQQSLDFLMGSPAAIGESDRNPLFDGEDVLEQADESLDEMQAQTIEAVQEALNTILETDRRTPKTSGESELRTPLAERRTASSSAAVLRNKRSAASVSSSSPARPPRGISVSNPTPRKRIFDDDEALESHLNGDDAKSDDEADDSMSRSTLLTPGRLISDDELRLELSKLSDREETVRGQEEVINTLIRKAELTGDLRERNILNRSYSALQRELRGIQFQRSQIEDEAAEHRLSPGAVSIAITGTTVSESQGRPFVLYIIEVHQLDDAGRPLRGWFVARRYSEFDHLDRALEDHLAHHTLPELPAKRLVPTMSSSFVEARRKGLERYLQTILRIPAVCSDLDFRKFLSASNITLPPHVDHGGARTQLASLPGQSVVRSLYRSVVSGIDDVLSAPSLMDAVIQRLDQQATNAPVSEEDLAGSGQLRLEEAANQPGGSSVETISSFTAPLCDLCIELFGLEASNNWLRKSAILIVLQQVLGGTIERHVATLEYLPYILILRSRFREGIKAALISSNFAFGLHLLRAQIFPLLPPSLPATRSPEQKAASRDAAAKALAALMPAMAASLIGRSNSRRAAKNIFAVVQSSRLNRHLFYVLLDEAVKELFGDVRGVVQ